jgi:hypothetical protein
MKAFFFLIFNANNQLLNQTKKVKSIYIFLLCFQNKKFLNVFFSSFQKKKGKNKDKKKPRNNLYLSCGSQGVTDQTQKGRSKQTHILIQKPNKEKQEIFRRKRKLR